MTAMTDMTDMTAHIDIPADGDKLLVVIKTAPTAAYYREAVTMMSKEELESAKLERPDLIFKTVDELDKEKESEGYSITDMVMPNEIELIVDDE